MKIVSAAIISFLFVICVAHGEISVAWSSSGGAYLHGGTWAGGPWPDYHGLRQLIWSAVDPVANGLQPNPSTANYLDLTGCEYLLSTYSSSSEDYCQWSEGGTAHRFGDADVGGNAITNGWLYSRIFQDPTPELGDFYYQSEALGPVLQTFNPYNPDSVIKYNSTLDGPVELNSSSVVIPEPATWVLLALGAAVCSHRRRA